ncbi:MAG TPA: VOC family protein [Acidimicrobiales bacterium]|nr:VOC family protein [Acidimicrobiales bacterium]
MVLESDDLEAAVAALVAAGVEIVQEPTDQPYGIRDAAVRDPSGNLVRINQRR